MRQRHHGRFGSGVGIDEDERCKEPGHDGDPNHRPGGVPDVNVVQI